MITIFKYLVDISQTWNVAKKEPIFTVIIYIVKSFFKCPIYKPNERHLSAAE